MTTTLNAVNNMASNPIRRLQIVEGVAAAAMPATTTLDAIPAPVASVDLNLKKIINLLSGTLATDAATMAQIWSIQRNVQPGTTYTLAVTDRETFLDAGDTSGVVLTIPLDASVSIPVGSWFWVFNNNTGLITVTPESGALTFRVPNGAVNIGLYGSALLYKRASNNWAIIASQNMYEAPRVRSIVTNANPTINTDTCDAVTITAQATVITSMSTNLSGTPANFQKLMFRIKDDGSARAITWGASFAARGVSLPTTTVAGKVTNVGFQYNTVTSTWDCIAAVTEV